MVAGKIINEVHCKPLCAFKIDVYLYSVYVSLYFLYGIDCYSYMYDWTEIYAIQSTT